MTWPTDYYELQEFPPEPLHEEIALHSKECEVWMTYSLEDCDCSVRFHGMEPDDLNGD